MKHHKKKSLLYSTKIKVTLGQFYKETTAGGTNLLQVDNLMHV